MTKKEYLTQARRLDRRINRSLEELSLLRETANRVRREGPDLPPSAEKILAMEARISREVDRLTDLKEEIRGVIDAVPDADASLILRGRYLLGKTWLQIADELYFSERTVRRKHEAALEQLQLPEGGQPDGT